MQKIIIEGRLGRNAEVKETVNNKKYIRFTMATNWKRGNDEKTTWYDVFSFNQAYTGNIVKYLTSGSSVVVIGDLEPEMNEGKDGKMYMNLKVRASSIDFSMSYSNKKDDTNTTASTGSSTHVKENTNKSSSKENDDIPDDNISCIPSDMPKPSPIDTNDSDDDDLPF